MHVEVGNGLARSLTDVDPDVEAVRARVLLGSWISAISNSRDELSRSTSVASNQDPTWRFVTSSACPGVTAKASQRPMIRSPA